MAIPYKGSGAIGNGEVRLGSIFGISPKGQNSPYDLDIPNIGPHDVKQLDQGTFNTGVSGRDKLRPIKSKIDSILTRDDAPEHIRKISPDEISTGNIQKIYRYVSELQKEKNTLIKNQKFFPRYHPFTGVVDQVSSGEFYMLLVRAKMTTREIMNILGTEYIHAKRLSKLRHPYIDTPDKMMDDLNGLVRIFDTIGLIFVDEHKGYYRMTETITFERVTKGCPRFRAHLQASLPTAPKSDTEQHSQSGDTSTIPSP